MSSLTSSDEGTRLFETRLDLIVASVVLALKADWNTRQTREASPPRYHGPRYGDDMEFLPRNAVTFSERQASRVCFGCTPAQLAEQGPIPHWECKHHGQDASEADRADRVPGSGRQGLGPLFKRQN